MSAIEVIEKEIVDFFQKREAAAKNVEQAIAHLHAVEGAIQGAQHLVAKLKAAAAEAEALAKKAAGVVEPATEKVATEVKEEAAKVIPFVKKDL